MLNSLISTSAFDSDVLRFESQSIRTSDEKEISYLHFGVRLIDLYEELENPKPRGRIETWMQRRSGARHAMMATMVGVAIAIILGIAALAMSAFQAYLTYQQWQHPVQNN